MDHRKHWGASFAALALLCTTGCEKPALELPTDAVERAAMCQGAFTALAQGDPNFESAGFSEDAINRAIHFAYLAGGTSGVLDRDTVQTVAGKAPAYASQFLSDGGVEEAVTKCQEAYPAARAGGFKGLPADEAQSRFTCAAITAALVQTYGQSPKVRIAMAPYYSEMAARIEPAILADLESRGIDDAQKIRTEFDRALAGAMNGGPPSEIIAACMARYRAGA